MESSKCVKQTVRKLLTSILGFFVYPEYKKQADLLERSYLLIGLELLIVLYTSFITIISFIDNPEHHLDNPFAIGIAWFSVLIILGLLLFYKFFGNLLLCSNIAIVLLIGLLTTGTLIAGGPVDSGFGLLFCIPGVLAFSVYGFRFGVYWSCANFLILCLLILVERSQYPMPQIIDEAIYLGFTNGHLLSSFCVVSAIIGAYELNNTNLTKRLNLHNQRYRHMATHDPLTGLGNRTLFEEHLDSVFEHAKEFQQKFAVVLIDLDKFKPLNDNYGHNIGDKVLITIGERLREGLREQDFISRLGGDEFILVVENIRHEQQIIGLIEKLQKLLEQPLHEIGLEDTVSASMGYAIYPDHSQTSEGLISLADDSMYNSKRRKQ